ncbi:permease prefix domain 1-containing protein [Sporosarcina sp. ACRSL]|uniref:permease prefix domain 1-containing protein n=1 Tax=Sporosarcina sp. ACRSL TaxID=2918215 RepID=UPI001EF6342E|nr:permease prefix domain 1-containing protein [Sporosarcina sp. ACRSL]MCG7345941.1 permease prefix domain 1-containing protein [Sporosarcina sp. ACRSL]
MRHAFERFVEGIVRETDSNREERKDLYEELLSHLECSFIDYQKQGFSEEEAMRTAMTNFGEEREIGKQLQQAMYPYRREMMLSLSVASLLFAYVVYICQLFVMGDAHIPWLIVAVLISTALLVTTVRPVSSLNRRLWVNSLLLTHILTYFYGLLLATDVYHPISIGLTIIAGLILILAIVLVYRTTIYDYSSKRQPLVKDAKRVHFVNITTGIFIVLVTLFFLWSFLLFSVGMSPRVFILFIPLVIWIISYASQMHLLSRQKKKWAYTILFIQTAVILWAVGFLLLGALGGLA